MKLIKLNESHYIIVDESKQPVEGYYYDNFIKDIRDTRGAEYGQADHCWQITHSTQPLEYVQIYADIKSGWYWGKIKQLSLSEVKELIGEVGVEKKAEEKYPTYDGDLLGIAYNQKYSRLDYIAGYNQAIEDNKGRKYTEEDMRVAIRLAATSKYDHRLEFYSEEEIFKLLQPPTSWDVEFVNGKLKPV